jgi:hypothetical protein
MRQAGNNFPKLQRAGYLRSVQSHNSTFTNRKVTAAGNNRVTNECRACHSRLEFLHSGEKGVDPILRRCANFLVATALMLCIRGTTLVGPFRLKKELGFSPCAFFFAR